MNNTQYITKLNSLATNKEIVLDDEETNLLLFTHDSEIESYVELRSGSREDVIDRYSQYLEQMDDEDRSVSRYNELTKVFYDHFLLKE